MVLNITEGSGELNFTVMWVSIDRRPCVKHFSYHKDALKQYWHLEKLGHKPSLMIKVDAGAT